MTSEFAGHVRELRRLVTKHDEIGAVGHFDVRVKCLAPQFAGQLLGASGPAIGDQHGVAPAACERTRHVASADQTDKHLLKSIAGGNAPTNPTLQLWLKKPFSSNSARCSADTSTLRGVSRNTLSAIRCMPPSSA